MPTFSIIVPIYKIEAYMQKCVDSILQQTYKDFEVLLIDDGSPDGCPAICDAYAQMDSRVRVCHKKNAGLVKARETGLEMAEGTYVGYVDGDDWIEPDLLQAVADVVTEYHADMISYGIWMDYAGKKEEYPCFLKAGFYDKKALQKEIYPYMLYNRNADFYNFGIYPSVWSKFIKKEIWIRNRCRNPEITIGEDAACVYPSLLDADSFYLLDRRFYHYLQNTQSMTQQYHENEFEQNDKLLCYMDEHLKEAGYGLDEQLQYHKAFRVKHMILNESKAPGGLRKRTECLKQRMEKYGFADAFDQLQMEHASKSTRIFVWLIRSRNYMGLILMCMVFNFLQKRK